MMCCKHLGDDMLQESMKRGNVSVTKILLGVLRDSREVLYIPE